MCARENVAHQFRNLYSDYLWKHVASFKAYCDAAAASSQVSMGGGASKARGEGHVRVHYLDGKGVPQRGEGVHAEKIEGWSKEDIKSTSRRERDERGCVCSVCCVCDAVCRVCTEPPCFSPPHRRTHSLRPPGTIPDGVKDLIEAKSAVALYSEFITHVVGTQTTFRT